MMMKTALEQYEWIEDWAKVPASDNGRTHGVCVVNSGDVIVFHQASPAVLVFSPEGALKTSWGEYPGAHGLTLVEEDGTEYLWLTDQESHAVHKCTLEGAVVQELPPPAHPAYKEGGYVPTWVAVNEKRFGGNGDVWVADGYGKSLVHRFDSSGTYLTTIDGHSGAGAFKCPHGIQFDPRRDEPELLVADRGNSRVQVFDAEGRFKRAFGSDYMTSPDGFSFFGDLMIVPELTARLTLVDRNDECVAVLGENDSVSGEKGWPNHRGNVEPGTCNSPHSACADAVGNLFLVEWITGGRIVKLKRI
jgi:sugar lactone lactonase YvrE